MHGWTATKSQLGCKRLLIALSVATYFLLGAPVWWYTTRVPRPDLPHAAMQQPHAELQQTQPQSLPVTLHVYAWELDQEFDAVWIAHAFGKAVRAALSDGGPAISQVSVTHERGGRCDHSSMTSARSRSHSSSLPCLHLSRGFGINGPAAAAAQLGRLEPDQLEQQLQRLLHQQQASHPGEYVLFLLPGPAPVGAPRLTVGQHRHAWLWEQPGSHSSVGSHSQDLCQSLEDCCTTVAAQALGHMIAPGPMAQLVQSASSMPTSPAGDTLLQFTLVNAADPAATSQHNSSSSVQQAAGYHTWQFDQFSQFYLQPLVDALAPLATLRAAGQVRLEVAPGVAPTWSPLHNSFVIPAHKLAFLVTPEWGLEFGLDAGVASQASNLQLKDTCPATDSAACGQSAATATETTHLPAHVLHMVLYLPPSTQQPLTLLSADGTASETNSYRLPAWGAVHVVKQAPGSQPSASTIGTGTGMEVSEEILHTFASSVYGQLRALFGLPELPGAGSALSRSPQVALFLPSDQGVCQWEVDALSRARAISDMSQAARILDSFSRLTQMLPNLAMPDVIGAHVASALGGLRAAGRTVQAGQHAVAVRAARQAHAQAEAAFSHPAVLAQLSFPESHKVGVYVPFFVPAILPVVVALLTELKHARKRWREYRRAQRAQQAAVTGVPEGLSVEELDQWHMMQAAAARKAAPAATPG